MFVKKNGSTILTCVGGAGVVATSVMAAKATPKVLMLLDNAREEKGDNLTKFESFIIAGHAYIPAIIVGASTIACIFGANILNKRTQATLMSAYALLDNSYKEYKKKVDEVYGVEAGKNIRAEIAKDKYTNDIISLDNKELFYDFYSGRYFESTKETVIQAQYEINRALIVNNSVSLNEYYEILGLERKAEYELVGWSCSQIEEMYGHPWIEFDHEETTIDEGSDYSEGLKCTIIYFPIEPVMNYLNH